MTHNGRHYQITVQATSVPGIELADNEIIIRVTGGRHEIEARKE